MLLDSGHLSNYSYSQKVLNYLTLILNEGHSLYVQTAVFLYLSARKNDDRRLSVIACQNCNRWQQ